MWKWGAFYRKALILKGSDPLFPRHKLSNSGKKNEIVCDSLNNAPHNAADNSAICAILFALLLVLLYQHNYAVKYAKYRGIVSVQ